MDNNLQVSPVPDSDHEQQEANDLLLDEVVTGHPKQTTRSPERLTDYVLALFIK